MECKCFFANVSCTNTWVRGFKILTNRSVSVRQLNRYIFPSSEDGSIANEKGVLKFLCNLNDIFIYIMISVNFRHILKLITQMLHIQY